MSHALCDWRQQHSRQLRCPAKRRRPDDDLRVYAAAGDGVWEVVVVAVRMCTCQEKGNIWRWELFGFGGEEKKVLAPGEMNECRHESGAMAKRLRKTVVARLGNESWCQIIFFRQQCVLHCSVLVGGIAVLRYGHWNTDFALIVEKFWWLMQVPWPKSDRHSSAMTRTKKSRIDCSGMAD